MKYKAKTNHCEISTKYTVSFHNTSVTLTKHGKLNNSRTTTKLYIGDTLYVRKNRTYLIKNEI